MEFANLLFKELVNEEEFKSTILIKKIDEAVKCNIKKLVLAPVYYDEKSKTSIDEIIKNNKKIDKLVKEGCLFQLNPASLEEVYGKTVKKTAKALIKKNIYKFIGFEEKIDKKLINNQVIDISKNSLFILNSENKVIKKSRKSKFSL